MNNKGVIKKFIESGVMVALNGSGYDACYGCVIRKAFLAATAKRDTKRASQPTNERR
jgi:hypothetical protein